MKKHSLHHINNLNSSLMKYFFSTSLKILKSAIHHTALHFIHYYLQRVVSIYLYWNNQFQFSHLSVMQLLLRHRDQPCQKYSCFFMWTVPLVCHWKNQGSGGAVALHHNMLKVKYNILIHFQTENYEFLPQIVGVQLFLFCIIGTLLYPGDRINN